MKTFAVYRQNLEIGVVHLNFHEDEYSFKNDEMYYNTKKLYLLYKFLDNTFSPEVALSLIKGL